MSFDGCLAKVKRAKEHRDALKSEISAVFAERNNLPRVGTKYEEETGDHVLYVSYMPNLSALIERASLLFGDSIHNLRSALDHLVYTLARIHKKGEIEHPRRLAFPVTDTEDNWRREAYRLSEVSPEDRAIIEWYQPYNALARASQPVGSPTLLGYLRDLDDWDKHRLLTPVLVPGSGLQNPEPQALAIWTPSGFASLTDPSAYEIKPVELGTIVARAKFPDGIRLVDMDMAAHLAPMLNVLNGQFEIVEVLDTLSARVSEIIERFSSR
jgi:hypothetical protein